MESLSMQHLVKNFMFTHVSNTPNSIRENSFEAINSENNSNQYFTLHNLKTLNYNRNNGLSVLHVKINSLQYYFNDLQLFLSIYPIDFQMLGNSEKRLKLTSQQIQICNFLDSIYSTPQSNLQMVRPNFTL